ncbi:MAG: phosphoribosylformylglycinamidine cyclo-ligase [Candidatus Diapherotrites archaeon]|uniref:Phosphoribosylformylglycinamidine cyclo-ligase n=1 Tax=Candidatus Iainarchaeum sp. TaxID=3101447 RepID=A0A2D6LNV1_9ARCH|nr:phosphoribosylformylglycinamidine cyclo-ligase [Candidatus Diapherotrites archaeon]|tara:strand:+ start:14713 stop:15753 length:1041 start_codon:yes stop_codon:yes gene_type:complete
MASYKDAGVDIDAGNESVERIKNVVKETHNAQVLTGLGSFGGAFSLAKVAKMKNPILVSTIDGVGTKLKVASKMENWKTIGHDIVNHCSNDILALGAKPLFFLDYLASDKILPKNVQNIVTGMAKACKEIDCALIGGETAEMPGVYEKKEHDVVGCMVGVVEKANLVDGSKIKSGDAMIGLAADGLHTNGYSLARHVLFEQSHLSPKDYFKEFNGTLGDELLKVHRSYSKVIISLMGKIKVKGISHITGGGLVENVPRILPKGLKAEYNYPSIKVPYIFKLIQSSGNIDEKEMYRAFNMGVGLVIVVSKKDAEKTIEFLNKNNEKAWLLGDISENGKESLDLPEIA